MHCRIEWTPTEVACQELSQAAAPCMPCVTVAQCSAVVLAQALVLRAHSLERLSVLPTVRRRAQGEARGSCSAWRSSTCMLSMTSSRSTFRTQGAHAGGAGSSKVWWITAGPPARVLQVLIGALINAEHRCSDCIVCVLPRATLPRHSRLLPSNMDALGIKKML